ncbi:hypothetical protein PALI_b0472 [Pseudoalteromonas aliena SW19]|uniref:Uncharacterized protein n=1 Tax=Pseudoalteromonas aliena SW19 TaxID=1314866 RepID=A0ABR9E4F1_9GAMM|nr:hypothetical protein [Pseudoalteromonas aliena SW19]
MLILKTRTKKCGQNKKENTKRQSNTLTQKLMLSLIMATTTLSGDKNTL